VVYLENSERLELAEAKLRELGWVLADDNTLAHVH
jgi:hypothetical protein